jgi:hypothetical protein
MLQHLSKLQTFEAENNTCSAPLLLALFEHDDFVCVANAFARERVRLSQSTNLGGGHADFLKIDAWNHGAQSIDLDRCQGLTSDNDLVARRSEAQ